MMAEDCQINKNMLAWWQNTSRPIAAVTLAQIVGNYHIDSHYKIKDVVVAWDEAQKIGDDVYV